MDEAEIRSKYEAGTLNKVSRIAKPGSQADPTFIRLCVGPPGSPCAPLHAPRALLRFHGPS